MFVCFIHIPNADIFVVRNLFGTVPMLPVYNVPLSTSPATGASNGFCSNNIPKIITRILSVPGRWLAVSDAQAENTVQSDGTSAQKAKPLKSNHLPRMQLSEHEHERQRLTQCAITRRASFSPPKLRSSIRRTPVHMFAEKLAICRTRPYEIHSDPALAGIC